MTQTLSEPPPKKAPPKNASPEGKRDLGPDSACCLSRLLFCYVNNLVNTAYRRPINGDDIFELWPTSEVSKIVSQFDFLWQPEGLDPKQIGEWTLLRKVMKQLFGRRYCMATLGMLIQQAISMSMPLLLREFVNWFMDPTESDYVGWVFGACISFLGFVGSGLIGNRAILHFYVIGMDCRSLINSVVYRKATRLSQKARSQTTTGQVLAIMSGDSERIPMALLGLQALFVSPVTVIIGLVLLVWVNGWGGLVAIVFMFLSLPVPMKIGAIQGKAIAEIMRQSDIRIKLVNEGIQGVKVLKYYAWDMAYGERVRAARKLEMAAVRKQAWAQSFAQGFAGFSPIFMSMGMVLVFYLTDRENFTAANVFAGLTIINVIRMPLFMLPMGIMGFVGIKATLTRLQRYLLLEEGVNALPSADNVGHIEIRDASFEWEVGEPIDLSGKGKGKGKADSKGKGSGKDEPEASKDTKTGGDVDGALEKEAASFKLQDINVAADAGQLCMVVGKVGSGKSSLLSAFLRQIPKRAGEVQVGGSIAYCAQVPWIMNATLRENILFGQPMDESRYDETIDMCVLGPDCENLPGGDLTEIGEKGVTLSGGQKARVALARAVYRQATVYFLDDVLSAVDSETGNVLFDSCIRRLTAKGSVVVLATNNVHFLDHADAVWVLQEGKVVEQGTCSELRAISNGVLNELLSSQSTSTEEVVQEDKASTQKDMKFDLIKRTTTRLNGDKMAGELTKTEQQSEGTVSWRVWFYYFVTCSGGARFFLSLVFFSLLTQASKNFFEWWLSHWTEELQKNPDLGIGHHYTVYAGLGVFSSILVLGRQLCWSEMIIRNAQRLHEWLLHGVMRAPMSFFDTTPIGRIMNRFSKDIESMDQKMQQCLPQFQTLSCEILGICMTIALNMPLFFTVLIPTVIFYLYVTHVFRPINRDLQRLESVSRSPLFAQFSETLVGMSTIQAYADIQRFLDASTHFINKSNRAFFTIHNANRWLQIRLDAMGCVLTTGAICFAILGRSNGHVTPGVVALALYYLSSITGFMNFTIRMGVETEARMTSTERIHEYAVKLPVEAPYVTELRPPENWPSVGRIELKNISMRYRPKLPQVLNGLSVVIEGGMKVGICGRTGCGKSTLFGVLFRLVDIGSSNELGSGEMLIDSVDILKLGVHDLRRALAIIPQDAVMFSGTIRDNLDLFHEQTEDQLWAALRLASLETVVQQLPDKLEATVQEGGENFSCGQRQLVCLARALLRQSRIICLDEATANIDVNTDKALQEVIKTGFKDRTVLTIAHRLNTIMHSDRILFLENGQVAEFAAPAELLSDGRESRFRALVQELGEESAAEFEKEVLAQAAPSDKQIVSI